MEKRPQDDFNTYKEHARHDSCRIQGRSPAPSSTGDRSLLNSEARTVGVCEEAPSLQAATGSQQLVSGDENLVNTHDNSQPASSSQRQYEGSVRNNVEVDTTPHMGSVIDNAARDLHNMHLISAQASGMKDGTARSQGTWSGQYRLGSASSQSGPSQHVASNENQRSRSTFTPTVITADPPNDRFGRYNVALSYHGNAPSAQVAMNRWHNNMPAAIPKYDALQYARSEPAAYNGPDPMPPYYFSHPIPSNASSSWMQAVPWPGQTPGQPNGSMAVLPQTQTSASQSQFQTLIPPKQYVHGAYGNLNTGIFRMDDSDRPAAPQTGNMALPPRHQSVPVIVEKQEASPHELAKSFKQRRPPAKFFKVGKVFIMLWTEALGDDNNSMLSRSTFTGAYGEKVISKVRRFVVISQQERHCIALPILTYRNEGVANQGVCKCDNGIVYSGKIPPFAGEDELPKRGESGMVATSVRIDMDDPTEKLHEKSRINYAKMYSIEYKVKVKSVGMVNPTSLQPFLMQARLMRRRLFPADDT